MLTSNIDDVIKDLQQKIEMIERKLTVMVKSFIYNVTVKAIDITPYGSSEYVNADGEIIENKLYYLKSREKYFLSPRPGQAKGGWNYSFGYLPVRKPIGHAADSADAADIKAERESDLQKYKLGQAVYLYNAVPYMATEGFTLPYMRSLENGYSQQAPNGITAPLEEAISGFYSHNLVNYYKEAQ